MLCALKESDLKVPEDERSRCETDIGDAILLDRAQPAVLYCHGDPAYLAASGLMGEDVTILAYGSSITIGPFTCLSRTTGMACTDSSTGHGFRLARASYELH